MANEQLIRQIIDTYNLDSRVKESIILIATNNINDLHIDGFDNVYTYTAELIEKFEGAYRTRAFKSLESRISPDSEDTLCSIFGVRDKNLESLFEEQQKEQQKLSAKEILDILRSQIDATSFKALKQLFLNIKNEDFFFPLSADEIMGNTGQIQHRLEELARNYEKRGRIIIPQRAIIEVKFDPLQIKYGNRFYNRNPLAFFQEHKENYRGLGRGEFSIIDSGLYVSLLRYNQLDKAIPLKNRKGSSHLPLTAGK